MKKYEILLALSGQDSYRSRVHGLALEQEGHQVTMVLGNEDVIKTLQPMKFDLIITDLPAILSKGKELNSEVLGLFVVNSYSQSNFSVHAFRVDADDYLFQPFGVTELVARAARCIRTLELERDAPWSGSHRRDLNEKGQTMLKVLSHDMRGSLLSLSFSLKLLIRGHYGKIDDGALEQLRELFSKTNGLIGMTDECLGRRFLGNDDRTANPGVLDLMQDIIKPVLEELSTELKGHRLLIDNSFTRSRISVKGGWVWLKTVLRNLLKNAITHGEKECTISLGFEDRGSSYHLNVYNSGKPIPEEYRDKLFSEFMQLRNRRNEHRNAEGMGLGLYLIKEIIQKEGGDIWYEATENGSNFVFTLPSGVSDSSRQNVIPAIG
jgi:signal transduction histidine kinase